MEFQPTMEPRKAAYHIRLCDRGLISVAGMKVTGLALALKTPLGDLTVPFAMVKEITFAKPGDRRDAVAA